MSNSKKTIQNNSRRNFLYQSSLASLGLVFMGKNALAINSFFLLIQTLKLKGCKLVLSLILLDLCQAVQNN